MLTVITCPALPAVDNGMVVYFENTTASSYDFGTQAMYKCNESYTLVRGDAVRTCVGNGSSPTGVWNGTSPSCSGISNFQWLNTCTLL